MRQLSIRTAPIPMRQLSSTVAPCTIAPWPTLTLLPKTVGVPRFTWTTQLSCTLQKCRTNPNEHGSATTTKIVRTAIPGDSGVVTWSDTGNDYFKKVYWNQQRPLTDWNVQPIGSGDVRATADFRINEFGLFDGYWMVVRDRTQRYGDIWSKEGLETIERTESTTKAGSTLTALVSVNQVKYRYAVTRNALRAAQQVQRGKTIAGRKSHIIGHLGGGLIAYIVYKYEKQVELKTVTSQVSPAQGG